VLCAIDRQFVNSESRVRLAAAQCGRSMKDKSNRRGWIFVRFRFVTANFDPEVLQWSGRRLIPSFLWLYVAARLFWSAGSGSSVALAG
jgi:hypothetical protein